ncbi:hypothetical protein OG439_23200 [Amycolatopsis sp. NBC_01307]|uniref:hypothetical protein n=1 Tax=Amycolatopsis sp. NBC_01307 TaxID=2903561 RepID=UPI002E0E0DF6|nr:hypothetical protein OG439_23200 [Amycolatopsis sp. NBC_01307]
MALGALGMLNLVLAPESGGYPALLLTLLRLGVGLLTTATACGRGGAPERAGIASGSTTRPVRRAARWAWRMVGEPTRTATFVTGLHTAGVIAAALWLTAILVTLAGVRTREAVS